jgi:tetratricopeptide (TPR) repeat protein
MRRIAGSAIVLLIVICSAAGCSRPPTHPPLRPVTLPDLTSVDPAVQQQIRDRFATVDAKKNARPESVPELADAYGALGMLLHAAEFFDAALPCYLNAQTLAPSDIRWPYYLGHLYKVTGKVPESTDAFARALAIKPDDLPTLIWLARLYLDQGRPNDAEPLLTKALSIQPRAIAALAALGTVKLAQRDYTNAAARFEEALAYVPESVSLHSPLASAYRALGRTADAEAHLKLWRNRDILLLDPLKQELDLLLESGLSYELRGVRALEAQDFPAAASFFRKGVALTEPTAPLGRSLRHKLGTALVLSGDADGAIQQFNDVVRAAPPNQYDESAAKAHYSLGLIMASRGEIAPAINHMTAAVSFNATYLEARVALADLLRGAGRVEASLPQYREAVTLNPRAVEPRFGYAMALAGLRRYKDAREVLEEAIRVQPDRQELSIALARLLAAAPDEQVRDGRRALMIVDDLFKTNKTTALGETMAMALAEVGDFGQAVGIQREIIQAAQKAGLDADARRMSGNLALYERQRPCRKPWSDDEPLAAPLGRNAPGT